LAELSDADILRILELVDQSSFDYFQLTLGDLHLTVSKTGLPPEAATPYPAAPAAASSGAPPASPATAQPAPATPPAPAPPQASPEASTPASHAAGLVPIPSPMVGTFYVAPAPDAPPFVEIGAAVQDDTTVGLVEAMKVFTGVLAGTRGVIAERLVENAQFVEYGQPLFLIQPETT
jgi:acetyl-CoA carboxylase biotin carboxyl carrier protein